MAEVTIELDTPEGVELCGYERHEEGHAFEMRWRWPERCVCESCGHEEAARLALKDTVYVVRDLELWGQPSFWVYPPSLSRLLPLRPSAAHLPPPFRRKDVSSTYRFEEAVLRSLIGSTEEDEACLQQLSPGQRQQVRTHRTDMSPAYAAACGKLLPESRQVIDRFHVVRLLGDAAEGVRKKSTRAYKKTLPEAEKKNFSSLMWECRRRPDYDSQETQAKLEELFDELPEVGFAVSFRWSVTAVFDTVENRADAETRLAELRELLDAKDTEFHKFFATYDRWKNGILAYFDRRQTRGPVDLHLDLNRAHQAVRYTLDRMHDLARAIRSKFARYYT